MAVESTQPWQRAVRAGGKKKAKYLERREKEEKMHRGTAEADREGAIAKRSKGNRGETKVMNVVRGELEET